MKSRWSQLAKRDRSGAQKTSPVRGRPQPARWPAVLLLAALLAVGLPGCAKSNGDAQALARSLRQAAATPVTQDIGVSVGLFPLSLARCGLAFVKLDPDARAALSAVHAVELGICEFQPGRTRLRYDGLLSAADKTMSERGWDRVVTVLSEHEFVAVFVRPKTGAVRDLELCLAVVDGTQMVVASARGNPEPLLEIALRHAHRQLSERPDAFGLAARTD